LTRDQFNELPQIDVQVALGQPGVGQRVSERTQRSTRSAAHRADRAVFHDGGAAVSRTDAAAVLPERLATLFCNLVPLKIVSVSFGCRACPW
jgi:hypothetical protein